MSMISLFVIRNDRIVVGLVCWIIMLLLMNSLVLIMLLSVIIVMWCCLSLYFRLFWFIEGCMFFLYLVVWCCLCYFWVNVGVVGDGVCRGICSFGCMDFCGFYCVGLFGVCGFVLCWVVCFVFMVFCCFWSMIGRVFVVWYVGMVWMGDWVVVMWRLVVFGVCFFLWFVWWVDGWFVVNMICCCCCS